LENFYLMKSTVNNFKNLLRNTFSQLFEAGHVDRSKRKGRGYAEADADVDYTDVPELDETVELSEDPGVSQSKRLAHGYKGEAPADYDVPGEGLKEDEMAPERDSRAKMYLIIKKDDPLHGPPVDDHGSYVQKHEEMPSLSIMANEVTPPGGEKMVKALKKKKQVDNPWAVAWAAKKKGKI